MLDLLNQVSEIHQWREAVTNLLREACERLEDFDDLLSSTYALAHDLDERLSEIEAVGVKVRELATDTAWSHEVIPEGVPVYVRESEAGGYEWRPVEAANEGHS